MSGWNGRIGSQPFVYEHTHSQSLSPLKRNNERPRRSTVSNGQTRGREKNSRSRFFDFLWCILWLNDTSYTTKVSEWTNKNMPASNTLIQLLALYTNPESQNAQRHRQADRQDRRQDYANNRSYSVAVRSANTRQHSYRKEDRAMRPIYGCT